MSKAELDRATKLKTALDNSEAQIQSKTILHAKMKTELNEQATQIVQLSNQLQELHVTHITQLTAKESELIAQNAERESLRSGLESIPTGLNNFSRETSDLSGGGG